MPSCAENDRNKRNEKIKNVLGGVAATGFALAYAVTEVANNHSAPMNNYQDSPRNSQHMSNSADWGRSRSNSIETVRNRSNSVDSGRGRSNYVISMKRSDSTDTVGSMKRSDSKVTLYDGSLNPPKRAQSTCVIKQPLI